MGFAGWNHLSETLLDKWYNILLSWRRNRRVFPALKYSTAAPESDGFSGVAGYEVRVDGI